MKKFLIKMVLVCSVIFISANISQAQFFFMDNPLIGQTMPEFTLKPVTGNKDIAAKDYVKSKKSILFFWATWCPHCRVQLKELYQKRSELRNQNIQLVIINLGEKQSVVQRYLEKNELDLEVFLDEDSQLGQQFAIVGVPTFFFIDDAGVVKTMEHELAANYMDQF